MVMVKPSYSFPASFMLGTLELTVKPSLVLLLNCFRKQTQTHTHMTFLGSDAERRGGIQRFCNIEAQIKIRYKSETKSIVSSVHLLALTLFVFLLLFTFIMGRRSSTLLTFSRACRTSSKPLGLYALGDIRNTHLLKRSSKNTNIRHNKRSHTFTLSCKMNKAQRTG